MNLNIVGGRDWHKFDFDRCQVNFIYVAPIHSKGYLMTLFNWNRFRTYSLIINNKKNNKVIYPEFTPKSKNLATAFTLISYLCLE